MTIEFGLAADAATGTTTPTTPCSAGAVPTKVPTIPEYIEHTPTYRFVYLQRFAPLIFDHPFVVSAILWGNAGRLARAVQSELHAGQRVLQAACVYGDFSSRIARFLGPKGRLDVIDVVPLQVTNGRRKLRDLAQAAVFLGDAAAPVGRTYDAVCCFFLLHELPDDNKRRVVNNLLDSVRPGGKVIFVDYHRPHQANPIKGIIWLVFRYLEPFAQNLWEQDVRSFASDSNRFSWRTKTYFGGLFQRTVAQRPLDDRVQESETLTADVLCSP